jgi:myo-inositol 2-dehydrogenase/D-chiro-inositol 1-dehydrogenase
VAEEFDCDFSTSLSEDVLARVDAVIVASTTDTHYGVIKAGLLAGKSVFTEKPISHNPVEVREILELGKKSPKPFVVGYQRRCDRNYRALKQQVGTLGDLRMVKCCSRDNPFPPLPYLKTSGGIFHDMLSHDFDMIHFLSGQFPVAAYSVGHAYLPEIKAMDDVDTVCVTLKYASGMIAVVDSSRISAPGYDQRVEAFGEHGVAFVQNEVESTVQVGTVNGFTTPVAAYSFPQRYKDTYFQELTEFIEMINAGGKEDDATIERHFMTEKVCMAAELSCRLGREVKLSEVDELHKQPVVPYKH